MQPDRVDHAPLPLDRAGGALGPPAVAGRDPYAPHAAEPGAAGATPLRRAPWVSLLLTAGMVLGYFVLQTAAGLGALVVVAPGEFAAGAFLAPDRLSGLLWDHAGLAAWIGIAVAAPAAAAALWLVARWQGPGTARRRLALARPRRRDALAWLLAVLAFGWLYERAAVWLERPPLPPVMEQVFLSAGWLPALVVAVVALAPVFEELAFRGFCLGGLAPLGAVPAVGLSSALFALIHVQYDLFDVGSVFALGLVFGAARWQSGSTLLTLGLHAFHNGLASLQALWVVGGAPP